MKRFCFALLVTAFLLNIFGVFALADGENLASGREVTAESHIANGKSYAEMDRFTSKILTDGKYGRADFGDSAWAKFYRATGRILKIDLGENCTVDKIVTRFLQNSQAGVVAPKKIEVFVSQDGNNFARVENLSGSESPFLPSRTNNTEIAKFEMTFKPTAARYVALSFDVTVNTFVDELEIYGKRGSTLTPPTDFCDIIEKGKGEYLERDALGGVHDIVCFHAGYSPDNEILVNNTKDSFLYYIAYRDENRKVVDTMFDAVMLLTLQGKCPSGGNLTITGGQTVMSDWITLLDNYFHPEFNLFALDAATAEMKETLKLDEGYKTSVYLTIPYPKIGDIEFGDYDGDGKTNKIDCYQATLDVTKWFMDEVDKRFAEADFKNIELKGYFCNSEGITRQNHDFEWDFARDAAKLMHDRGLQCVMIPYYQAVGIDANDEFKFDAMLMQPNLSFNDSLKDDPKGMMEDFAQTAKQLGLGVQMEIADGVRWDASLGKYYEQYLVSASQNGLMTDTIHAYYNGAGPGVFYDCAVSANPELRWYYDATYKFIKGTLSLPDERVSENYTKELTVTDNKRVSGEIGINGDWHCTYRMKQSPKNGYANLVNGTNTFTYLADRKFSGVDSFTFEILYNGEVIGERTVTVNVDREIQSESSVEASAQESVADIVEEEKASALPFIIGGAALIAVVIVVIIVIIRKKRK